MTRKTPSDIYDGGRNFMISGSFKNNNPLTSTPIFRSRPVTEMLEMSEAYIRRFGLTSVDHVVDGDERVR